MSILHKARTLESRISRALNRAAATALGSSVVEPLEVVHAIVDDVEQQIQAGGRGISIFPFNRVAVSVLAPSREARARFEAIVSGKHPLRARLLERLRSAGCDVDDVRVEVTYVGRAQQSWAHAHFHVVYDWIEPVPVEASADPAPARVEVTVLRGTAERRTGSFAAARVELGRGGEVRDHRNRLLRINDVAFVEGSPGENQTVSRRHAHLAFDARSGDYRLYDDGSVHGTGIVRGGRTIPVPPGARGVRVRSGDEIVLGEARLRLRIDGDR